MEIITLLSQYTNYKYRKNFINGSPWIYYPL
jgi:hypothetical protein